MKRRKLSGKGTSLLLSLVTVAVALLYILFGDRLAGLLGRDTGNRPSTAPDGILEVHIIDVGQGDSILVRTDDGVLLIDAGTNSSEDELRAYLDACGVDDIDCFVCTHPHEDHIGGADMILGEYNVERLIMPETESTTVTFTKLLDALEASDAFYTEPVVGDVYTIGGFAFTILAPDESVADDSNNSSIVLRLDYGSTSFMFTGDAEAESEACILAEFSPSELDCDFLKLGHHGSTTSTTEEFLDAVSPEYAAISCGEGNSYGHPHRETLDKLASRGITGDKLLRTDLDGTCVVYSNGERISTDIDSLLTSEPTDAAA